MVTKSLYLPEQKLNKVAIKTRVKGLGLILACFSFLALLPLSTQAQLADDTTVLYYLIEMERRTGKGCAGESTDLPSIRPDVILENAARSALSTGQELQEILGQEGLLNAPSYKVFLTGATPKDAAAKLKNGNCPAMMDSRFTRIGAVKDGQRWLLIMAGEPVQEGAPAELIINNENTDIAPQNQIPQSQDTVEQKSQPYTQPKSSAPGPYNPETDPGRDPEPQRKVLDKSEIPHNLSPEEAAFLGVPMQDFPQKQESATQNSPQMAIQNSAQTSQPLASDPMAQEAKSRLGEGRSSTEALPAEPQVTGVYSKSQGMSDAPKGANPNLKPRPSLDSLVSDEIPAMDPKRQDPILLQSPTEALPAEPQVTGIYTEGKGVQPVDPHQGQPNR